jgi:hypothetical protein
MGRVFAALLDTGKVFMSTGITNTNRISAEISDEQVEQILISMREIRKNLPFLVTLSAEDRRSVSKMGAKSVGFDEKCENYMNNRPEFMPGFVQLTEVKRDRQLRAQMLKFASDLETLAGSVDDTLLLLSSEIWSADLAYYQSAREAARRIVFGAQDVYDDLSMRFPKIGRPAGSTNSNPSDQPETPLPRS